MMKKNLTLLFILFLSIALKAQQEPLYSIFWNNSSVFNPAFTGEQSKYYFSSNFQNQWTKAKEHPLTANGNIEWRIDSSKNAVGLNYTYSQLGLEKSNTIKLNYSHHIKIADDKKIGIGVAPAYSIKQYDVQQYVTIDDYTQDPSIPQNSTPIKTFDLSLGISYVSKKLNVGLSTTQLLESGKPSQYQNVRHSFLYGSYNISLAEKFKLTPYLLVATDYASTVYNISLITTYNDMIWLGGSFRKDVFLGVMGGVDIAKKYRVGYSFDYYTSNNLQLLFGNTHEIVVAIILN